MTWDRKSLLEAITSAHGETHAAGAARLIDWAVSSTLAGIEYNSAPKEGALRIGAVARPRPFLFDLRTTGNVEVLFEDHLQSPPFGDPMRREKLLALIKLIPGRDGSGDSISGRPRVSTHLFVNDNAFETFIASALWALSELRLHVDCSL